MYKRQYILGFTQSAHVPAARHVRFDTMNRPTTVDTTSNLARSARASTRGRPCTCVPSDAAATQLPEARYGLIVGEVTYECKGEDHSDGTGERTHLELLAFTGLAAAKTNSRFDAAALFQKHASWRARPSLWCAENR